MNHRFALAVVAVSLLTSACGPGGLLGPTVTPSPTETLTPTPSPTSTATATSTVTPTDTSTSTPTQTLTLTPTALSCPKGTVPGPSVNTCFYATRTPKPKIAACLRYASAAACGSNGCTWDKKTNTCNP